METLELIKNIPTFFSRNDEDIDISSITTTANSSEVRVTAEHHNLVQAIQSLYKEHQNLLLIFRCNKNYLINYLYLSSKSSFS